MGGPAGFRSVALCGAVQPGAAARARTVPVSAPSEINLDMFGSLSSSSARRNRAESRRLLLANGKICQAHPTRGSYRSGPTPTSAPAVGNVVSRSISAPYHPGVRRPKRPALTPCDTRSGHVAPGSQAPVAGSRRGRKRAAAARGDRGSGPQARAPRACVAACGGVREDRPAPPYCCDIDGGQPFWSSTSLPAASFLRILSATLTSSWSLSVAMLRMESIVVTTSPHDTELQ